jgi:hypothetical protein
MFTQTSFNLQSFLNLLSFFSCSFPFTGSFRCVKKTTTTSTTTTTARPENYYSRFTTERYTTPPIFCPSGFERNSLGACVGECLLPRPQTRFSTFSSLFLPLAFTGQTKPNQTPARNEPKY